MRLMSVILLLGNCLNNLVCLVAWTPAAAAACREPALAECPPRCRLRLRCLGPATTLTFTPNEILN